MKQLINKIKEDAIALLDNVASSEELESLRVRFQGKKGELTSVLKGLGGVSPEERPVIGQLANEVRALIEEKISQKKILLEEQKLAEGFEKEKLDVTMPGKKQAIGSRHPISKVDERLREIFSHR